MSEHTAEIDAPFENVPSGTDIARYFWHEVVMTDQQAPYRRGQYHGCDGISLWREGGDYSYLWVEATVDHDMWMAYLLEIRTKRGGVESRDYLYLAAGGGDLFEVEWRNQPIRFDASLDDHVDHHRAAMHWFVEREVGTIDDQNGGDQGIIDRAAARVIPPVVSAHYETGEEVVISDPGVVERITEAMETRVIPPDKKLDPS